MVMLKQSQKTPKVEARKNTCPQCGCDWDTLAACCSSDNYEDRCSAWIITENCPACKEMMAKEGEKCEAEH